MTRTQDSRHFLISQLLTNKPEDPFDLCQEIQPHGAAGLQASRQCQPTLETFSFGPGKPSCGALASMMPAAHTEAKVKPGNS